MTLVVGATGLLGNAVCMQLLKRGEKVRALTRTSSDPAKVAALRQAGVEIAIGDLKDPPSLAAACRDVDAIISTASSTLSRQPGDSIETVDHLGQLNLIQAAKTANVDRFVFVSFRVPSGLHFPLGDAKTEVEQALEGLNSTVLHASWFMEVWLSPALGFDYPNATATIYGDGTSAISWVSYADVAEVCAIVLRHPAAARKAFNIGGPAALSPLQVIATFQQIAGKPFKVQHVPQDALKAQFDAATDPLQKSFAALMLGYSYGDAMDMAPLQKLFNLKLTSVNDYAHRVIGVPNTASS